jgi:hypothetical protein
MSGTLIVLLRDHTELYTRANSNRSRVRAQSTLQNLAVETAPQAGADIEGAWGITHAPLRSRENPQPAVVLCL